MQWKKTWQKLTNWELWPFALRYAGLAPFWAWYCLRSGTPWFFTASNPTITFGGFDGEGKKEMYQQLPEGTYPRTIYIQPGTPFTEVMKAVQAHGFRFPFCVKPDVGLKGLLFRKIDTEAALHYYHQKVDLEFIVQDLILMPLEVSVFYYRFPNQQKGVITGFLQKDLMEVTGNGISTLRQLIQQHPIAQHRMAEMEIKHGGHLEEVIEAGHRYFLSYAANLNRGARFTNLEKEIDGDLHDLFDAISHQTSFYYGRFDIKCESIADLKMGRKFQILEFNGAGAEPNHVYQSGLSLLQAYRVLLQHWKVLFEISRYNHRNGHPYWSFGKGYHFMKAAAQHGKKLEQLDAAVLI
ncbi:hypothetical protein SAMN05444008_11912 [Cnuella takakiae]|uniref:ATP-grasp domain-containing protein n=1 Tax=Cnuella takakiae TaxID=1302690 RepID=A0A1M5HDJ3_9BACT|nr:hypothetical protein [Cnuella takakiae]OLY92833.1 hypothetical protein BUE76_13755 [Cnuella takakiae]SHG14020.1 hypothetical protein SAMN05444008_11912 [Cnuella takakiae]